jgi:hypothetical protein
MEAETVFKMLDINSILRWLITWEDLQDYMLSTYLNYSNILINIFMY